LPATLVLAAGLLASPGTSAAAGALVFPPDHALLDSGGIEVLGFQPAGGAATLAVRSAAGESVSYPVPAGLFRVPVSLRPGESVLSLGGASATVFVGAGGRIPEGFSPPDTHAVDNGCEDCHAVGKTGVELLQQPPALCANCHDEKGKGAAVAHPPVEEGDCLACHAFHGASLSGLPAAARRGICFGCHDDFTDGGKLRMHGPVAKGDCAGCHEVHGGSAAKLLPATGIELCLRCHDDPSRKEGGGEWETPHPALDDGCPSCHVPHASAVGALLRAPQPEVCGDCHDAVVPEGPEGAVVHPPVEEGECAGCHNPHGADQAKLLRAPGAELCTECHDDPARGPDGEEWATPHPALDDGCPTCHRPHASAQAALLVSPQAPLCFECHDQFVTTGEDGKPMHVHGAVAQGRCAGCHAPHGSAQAKLLRKPSPELCFICHQDPSHTPEGGDWAVPHPALDDGCAACHRPHVAPAPNLLDAEQAEVCAACHEDKRLDPEGEPWPFPHAPVRAGRCAVCHQPHGAPQPALLPKPVVEFCGTCHPAPHAAHLFVELEGGEPVVENAKIPEDFPIRKKDGALVCTGCHLPHGSEFMKLWNVGREVFCSQCHPY